MDDLCKSLIKTALAVEDRKDWDPLFIERMVVYDQIWSTDSLGFSKEGLITNNACNKALTSAVLINSDYDGRICIVYCNGIEAYSFHINEYDQELYKRIFEKQNAPSADEIENFKIV